MTDEQDVSVMGKGDAFELEQLVTPYRKPRSDESTFLLPSLTAFVDEDMFRFLSIVIVTWTIASTLWLFSIDVPSFLVYAYTSDRTATKFSHFTWLKTSLALYELTALMVTWAHYPNWSSSVPTKLARISFTLTCNALFLFWTAWLIVGATLLFADVSASHHTHYFVFSVIQLIFQLVALVWTVVWRWQ